MAISASKVAMPGDLTFCALTTQVGAAGKLREYSDKQIENGLCMTTKEVVAPVVANNLDKQEICMQASQYMIMEFKRRFPDRDTKSVAGKC